MTSETTKSFAEVMAENGRPVSPEGMRRAREILAARDSARGNRAELLERIRQHAPNPA